MNTGNEERFHELAHRALGHEAGPEEQAELLALIGENPGLKEEFEQLGAETHVAREMLLLMEDIQHPRPAVPEIPMAKLRARVAQGQTAPPTGADPHALLVRLRHWAARRFDTGGERQMEWGASIVGFSPSLNEVAANSVSPPLISSLYAAEPDSNEESVQRTIHELRELIRAREAALENRLRALQTRIRHAEQTARECQAEVERLIDALNRERREFEELLNNS